MYRVLGSVVYFSGIGDPSVTTPYAADGVTANTTNPGAGFIDLGQIDSDAQWLIGQEIYYKQVAIFSRRVCIFYAMDADPSQNALQQVLRIGAVSNLSIQQFGQGTCCF